MDNTAAKKRDPRLDVPGFGEAHKAVCKIVHEIDKTPYRRIPQLREAAANGDARATELLGRYEDAMSRRRQTVRDHLERTGKISISGKIRGVPASASIEAVRGR